MTRFVLSLLLVATAALAQDYPSRPVRLVVPLSPGGFADTPTRILAARLSEQFGRQFFVENKPGAGGTIGWDFVAKAAPDGYTLGITGTTHLISSHLYKNLQYDPFKDFTHISMMASGPYVLVVNPKKVPVANVRELIAAAKAKPGVIDYASSGNGSSQHLVGALFNSMAGVQLNHVPYKGSGPAMQDLLAGEVGVSFAGVPNVLGNVRGARLKAIAVTTPKRWVELPDVPTMAEAGVPGYEATLWLSISGPAGMPKDLVPRLTVEIAKALKDPDLQSKFREAGVEADSMSGDELLRYMHSEDAKWGKVVKETGATVN
ncbi:MAG: tripartite tricarboxylate transporter substrate binding protein [Betaproteobacteria bacterium]|nr:tripartite tricarboxylate transporter substrate binding protein [Betaproteobacteria bacterium]MBV9360851.1 tripartite tricarboxylate transporter substrate binding protein [Betaproteobacteria bacterium]